MAGKKGSTQTLPVFLAGFLGRFLNRKFAPAAAGASRRLPLSEGYGRLMGKAVNEAEILPINSAT
jgi:hypothetical protein